VIQGVDREQVEHLITDVLMRVGQTHDLARTVCDVYLMLRRTLDTSMPRLTLRSAPGSTRRAAR
jgi:hypothetical protein